jgi:FKBP-type peptidyl-prolyl cis-trans isomerase
MARKRDRMFALFGAVLFLITSSALAIAVIYTLSQQHASTSDGASSTQATSKAASKTTDKTGTSTSKTATNLAGTKMQGFTPLTAPLTKLSYTDITVGTGAVVKPGDTITADYVGALADTGVIFDASVDHGGALTFSLNQVIPGWTQAIPGMRVGGTRQLLIPASLAYGSQAQNGIPANSDLVFNVTIVAVK